MLFGILLFLFIVVCLLLSLLILIQSDKGGGISGTLGGLSNANSFLGNQDTANVLTKGTYIFGGVFLLLCLVMTFLSPKKEVIESKVAQYVTDRPQNVAPQSAPQGIQGIESDAQQSGEGELPAGIFPELPATE